MDRLEIRLPVYLPGQSRNWKEVMAVAKITEEGEIRIKLRDEKHAKELVQMAREGILYQVAFDYKMPVRAIEHLTAPKDN